MSDNRNSTSIGGYFELELPAKRSLFIYNGEKFQSARAAFLSLIRAGKPRKIWMPKYICNAMLSPLAVDGIDFCYYDLNDDFQVDKNITIGPNDWFFYVNYFGVCNTNVETLLDRFSNDNLIFDFSQAFFSPPVESALATIYSPRKFFGVPDGGVLISRVPVLSPAVQDIGSVDRATHLLKRLGVSPEVGYHDYQLAENSLTDCEPKRLSMLTERILSTVDFDLSFKKRHENFTLLHNALKQHNLFPLDLTNVGAPLCYPFISNNSELRRILIDNRIYVPTYWIDSIDRLNDKWKDKIISKLLPLPIDQRYGRSDMDRILSIILSEKL